MSFFWYATLLLYFKNSTLYFCTCIIQLYFSRFFKKIISTHIHALYKKVNFLRAYTTHIFIWNTNLEILITNHTILRVNIKIDKHKTGFCHSEAFSFSNIKFIKNIWLFIFTWFFQKNKTLWKNVWKTKWL